MKFSLINIAKEHNGVIDGNWLQNYIGELDGAVARARDIEKANSNRIRVAIVDEIPSTTPGYCVNLEWLG